MSELTDELADVLRGYEKWEAAVLMCVDVWSGSSMPPLTNELFQQLLELQTRRNAVLAKVEENHA